MILSKFLCFFLVGEKVLERVFRTTTGGSLVGAMSVWPAISDSESFEHFIFRLVKYVGVSVAGFGIGVVLSLSLNSLYLIELKKNSL